MQTFTKKKNLNIVVRISDDLKNQSKAVLDGYGMTISEAIRLCLEDVAKNGIVPDYMIEKISSKRDQ